MSSTCLQCNLEHSPNPFVHSGSRQECRMSFQQRARRFGAWGSMCESCALRKNTISAVILTWWMKNWLCMCARRSWQMAVHTSTWWLMVEEYPIRHKNSIMRAVIHRDPVGKDLRSCVRCSWSKWRPLRLWHFYRLPKHLGRACLLTCKYNMNITMGAANVLGKFSYLWSNHFCVRNREW